MLPRCARGRSLRSRSHALPRAISRPPGLGVSLSGFAAYASPLRAYKMAVLRHSRRQGNCGQARAHSLYVRDWRQPARKRAPAAVPRGCLCLAPSPPARRERLKTGILYNCTASLKHAARTACASACGATSGVPALRAGAAFLAAAAARRRSAAAALLSAACAAVLPLYHSTQPGDCQASTDGRSTTPRPPIFGGSAGLINFAQLIGQRVGESRFCAIVL